jgi:3-methyl-2-oxobutanoate hydroxymethyltransferase
VQVVHDILGLFEAFVPKHAHQYAQLGDAMRSAITTYKTDVEQRLFPTAAHAASIDTDLLAEL